MKGSRFVVPALCALVLAAAPAQAGRTVCHLLTDRKGDATQLYVAPEGTGPYDPGLDIRSADVASNGKRITTALRVDAFATSSDSSPLGYVWYVYFTLDGVEFFTQAKASPAGDEFSVGYVGAEGVRTALPNSAAKGAFTPDRDEIRVTFDAAQLAPVVKWKRGMRFATLRALSNRSVGVAVLQADEGVNGKPYYDGTPSCVKPVG